MFAFCFLSAAVLKSLPAFKAMKQEQMEHILDRFDARQELYEGDEVLKQGQEVRGRALPMVQRCTSLLCTSK